MRENSGSYYPKLAFIGPFLVVIALGFIIEGPKIPQAKQSVFGWVCIIIGAIVGIWNAFF